jgi:type I restriction enzyme S subunit
VSVRAKPYPKYTASGVEWLRDVPAHWGVKRLKLAAQLTDKKIEADEENPVPYIGMENIESWTGRMLPIDLDVVPIGTANAFKAGHTLFGKLRPYLAKACNPDFDGLCSTELLVLKGADLDRRVLLYSLLSDGFIKLVDSSTYGSKMPRASWDFVGSCVVPIAPPDEQRAIAEFLDHDTARIDALIEKKETLIDRLKEKRTALISRTVTRGLPPDAARATGLNPHPKLKLSGIEWFGEVPGHWKVAQLRRTCLIVDCMHRTVSFVDDGIPLASIREVHGQEVDLFNAKQTTEEEYLGLLEGGRKPRVGDIIYSRNATVGDASIVATAERFAMGQDVCLIRTTENHPRFLLYVLRSDALVQQLESYMVGATFRRINVGQIRAFWAAWPPLPEQRAIASFLDRETAKIDGMVAKIEIVIERLQEYRTALITAAVTGKIDVRGQSADNGRVFARAS